MDVKELKLSDVDVFVIQTLANYGVVSDLKDQGILTEKMFTNFFEKQSKVQRVICGTFELEKAKVTTRLVEIIKKAATKGG